MNAHQRRTALRQALRLNSAEARRPLTKVEVTATKHGWWWQLDATGYNAVTPWRHVTRKS